MDLTTKMESDGKTVYSYHSTTQDTEKYQQSVLLKNVNGKLDSLRRTYMVVRSVSKTNRGQKVRTSLLQGKTVLIQRKGKEVVVTSAIGILPQDAHNSLQDALEDGFDFVPDHAVAVRDEWEINPQKIAHSSLFKDVENARIKGKLLDIVVFDRHCCAHIHLTMRYEVPIDKDNVLQLDLGGEGYIALDIERILGIDLRGSVVWTDLNSEKIASPLNHKGTAHLKLVCHWEKVAGKAIVAGKL